ncbi:MAG: TonB-dependent receptor [Pseudomonadaceae bacterium]|nr:TonB-dependent receptor [Pseudomonadaceae bacterium]
MLVQLRPSRLLTVLIGSLFAAAPSAIAQEGVEEEIVVTGSFIRGTPEDAALPVDVLSRDDLDQQGSPSIVELVRNLGVSNGNLGETNQFNSSGGQGNEGVATVNLRGLGSARTLVLLNGRRHVSDAVIGVDISAIPAVAIERLEVLKDGAAALYGSDAIGGVANFITRDRFEGVELRASGQFLDESDGEFDIGGIWGFSTDRLHVALSAEYATRDKLRIRDRDWALPSQAENPQAGYSTIGNPGRLFPISPSAISAANPSGFVPSADPECATLGGTVSGSTCFFQFTQFDNLIEDTKTTKFFGEANYEVSDNVEFHFEALYSNMEMDDCNTSPSYPPQSLFGPDRLIPLDHPGVIDFNSKYPGQIPADTVALFTLTRMTGWGGFFGEAENGTRETDTYRVSTGLNGTLFDEDIGFDVAVSWSKRDRATSGPDMFVERMAFALDGLGGDGCDPATGTPGVGPCMYYTPFSNGVAQSFDGRVNPNANPNLVAMNEALFPWLVTDLGSENTYELLVFDLTFDGVMDVELGGGNIGWAAGIQTRNEKYELKPDAINDLSINPCPFRDPASITLGHTASLDCASPTGLFAFLSGTAPADTERTVYGGFVELALPFSDRLDAQFALRFEDYGGDVGSTVDPKVAIRFQATDAIALRGSVSSTFRGPPQNFLTGRSTSLQFVGPVNAFKAVDTLGNDALDPEKAITSNLGIIFDFDRFYGSLDYWRFDFEDPFQIESFNSILTAYGNNACTAGGAGVGSQTCNDLATHIVFQAGSAGNLSDIERLEVNWINGTDITTSGVDWLAEYDFDVGGGVLTVGTQGTHTIEYETEDFLDVNGIFLTAGDDFAGNLNDNRNTLTPIVDLQANVFAKFSSGRHNAQVIGRYWGEYDDPEAISSLQTVDSMFTVDLNYTLSLMEDQMRVNVSVFNALDEDPPQAQTDLNYDPYTHSAFGRMIKVGLVYQFGGAY